jgi:hypothetical protein
VSIRWEYFVELVRSHKQLELVCAKASAAAAEEGDPFAGVPTLEDHLVEAAAE